MKLSRRDLHLLLPALAAGSAYAQKGKLPSKTFKYEDLPVKASGQNRQRAILDGETHTGFAVEMHETELAPGLAPHPPHHHVHEEMMMLREGTMEVTIEGKITRLGPGSVVFVASNEEHGWKNIGTDRAKYFVLALRGTGA
jgi:quercetin dioxygenase-like cupin family protein